MKITVFGAGYVGLVYGACLANLGHDILCIDTDSTKIKNLMHGITPFYEPGLPEIVSENIKKQRLRFTTDQKEAVEFGHVLLNCVGTPSKADGSANLDFIFAVAKSVATHANGHKVLITKSTVPPGTAKAISKIIKETNPRADIDILSNPEFLKEGAAIYDFNHPDRVVIGSKDSSERVRSAFEEMYAGLIRPYLEFIYTNWETAELIKYASNTFLATKISFINEMANICDRIGADVKTVAKAMGLDNRIGPRFLNAGVGYGGSCFPKDVRALDHFAKSINYDAKIIHQVDLFNEAQKHVIVNKIKHVLGNLNGKVIAILGLSFKPKTSDMREAPSITIINDLTKEGAHIRAYDPEAIEEAKKIFTNIKITYHSSAYEAATGADAVVLVTEWDEFRSIDMGKIKSIMKNNYLFDGRNIYDPEHMVKLGFHYEGVGRSNKK